MFPTMQDQQINNRKQKDQIVSKGIIDNIPHNQLFSTYKKYFIS